MAPPRGDRLQRRRAGVGLRTPCAGGVKRACGGCRWRDGAMRRAVAPLPSVGGSPLSRARLQRWEFLGDFIFIFQKCIVFICRRQALMHSAAPGGCPLGAAVRAPCVLAPKLEKTSSATRVNAGQEHGYLGGSCRRLRSHHCNNDGVRVVVVCLRRRCLQRPVLQVSCDALHCWRKHQLPHLVPRLVA